ncbi:Jun dimerization protein 2 [Bagarius yarrelli]|uniref:Jun dimerization protein 2 n=1 Tax=Bagarius yarrelli TaxID=175774 RepID=A0A556VWC9_BAGYA|nr:Jun dimerization protein 2 [Bagarius yarrelli]
MTHCDLTHMGKRPLSLLQSETADEEERRKRRREKNKVAAARCRNKKKERTDFLQQSERLEVVNTELKSQIEELKQERQRLIHMLNLHRPTCIVRRDSVQTPESDNTPLLEQTSPS